MPPINHNPVEITKPAPAPSLPLELAMAVVRRRLEDLNDRLYQQLRPYGISL
jgi:hypothetical protein